MLLESFFLILIKVFFTETLKKETLPIKTLPLESQLTTFG